MAVKSKFFRVAREGDTADGRRIERSHIEQIVKNFNREKYGARIWLEHFRSLLPDSPFRAYGDVLAVKAEEVEIDGDKKLCLFAQIEPTQDLVAMNKAKQKLYTSCEIDPNFAKSGEAYLVGLAVTDSPASLGTEMLAFAATAKQNPLAARKISPENLFTQAHEVVLEFDEQPSGESIVDRIKTLLSKKERKEDDRLAEVTQALEALALSISKPDDPEQKQSEIAVINAQVEELKSQLGEFKSALTDIATHLSKENPGEHRPTATGSSGNYLQTDC